MIGRHYRKSIGVIAGLGPAAGAHFYKCLVEVTPAGADDEHPEVVLVSDPSIPSRLAHLAGTGPDPGPALCAVARRLQGEGCGVLVLTSVTTHAYYRAVASAVQVPVLDGRVVVASALAGAGRHRLAMVVTGVARTRGMLDPELHAAGLNPVYPDLVVQTGIDEVVAAVKAGRSLVESATDLWDLVAGPWSVGCDGVLVGCTDLAALVSHMPTKVDDISRLLASAAVEAAR